MIKFTQFVRPRGDKRAVEFNASPGAEALAKELVGAGWSFECEVLMNGEVHLDCCDEEEQLSNQVCENGPEVVVAVERLIKSAHASWVERSKPKAVGRRGAWLGRVASGQVASDDELDEHAGQWFDSREHS